MQILMLLRVVLCLRVVSVEPLPSADVHELSRVNLIKVRQPPNDHKRLAHSTLPQCNLLQVKTKQGVVDRLDDSGESERSHDYREVAVQEGNGHEPI